ncbi:hypothetical protein GBAR_LOCUS14410 [Geodia barretti]|uniref:Secreted protein n=1 Tax=Geodia barretti TaxID=519541 RepID=A0AA35S829_GEOBA|nr:hypothetical protein GBAR_LOCUS14410 [Geodia barretti]
MFFFALLTFTTFATTLATVDLWYVVGGQRCARVGMSVTLQCTLMGVTLTWETPDGALNFFRGRQNNSYAELLLWPAHGTK